MNVVVKQLNRKTAPFCFPSVAQKRCLLKLSNKLEPLIQGFIQHKYQLTRVSDRSKTQIDG